MNTIDLPRFDGSWLAHPDAPTGAAILKWQEHLRQITRQWLRADAPVADWLASYSSLRINLLRAVWLQVIPEHHRENMEYIVLGSTARGEDVFDSDLDYALFLHHPVNMETVLPYLYQFIERMAALGFPPCKGFVMGTNERWSGTEEEWEQRIESYFQFPSWENVRYLFMMLDSRVLTTEPLGLPDGSGTWEPLRQRVQEQLRRTPYLCWEMAHLGIQDTVSRARVNPALFRFGHGCVHIKSGLLSPVLHSIRLLAVAHGVFAVSTQHRLLELTACGALDRELAHRLESCIDYAYRTRIKQYIDNPDAKAGTDDLLLFRMSKAQLETLAEHIDTAKKLERMISRRFRKPR